MKTYKEFIELIKEGLIRTFNIYQYNHTLNINLNFIGVDNNITVKNKFQYFITVFNPETFLAHDEIYDLFFAFNNNMGYYPSHFILYRKDKYNTFKFNKDNFLKELKNAIKIDIYFDAKYEDSLYKNDLKVPELSYHLSPSKNRNKILKNGLYPKAGSRKSYHNDRIYLFYDLDDCENILKQLKFNDKINNKNYTYDLYEIKLTDNNIIHSDPNYLKGFFTYDNIPPMDLKIIKKEL